jgi:xanthine dehydrogenase accessory factor
MPGSTEDRHAGAGDDVAARAPGTVRDEVAARAAELIAAGVPFVHATVVRAQKPASARPGASALVRADGEIEGFVGGTCAESSVQAHSLAALETGEPLLLRIMPGASDTAEEDGAVTVRNPCLSGGALEIFLEPRRPQPRLLVAGDTPVGRMLLRLGAEIGFAPRGEGPPAEDDAAVVVASHGRGEEPVLEAALRAGVPYVALVASRTRGTAVVASLDVTEEERARVHTPAGLAIGARTAAEVALSILAEIVSLRPASHATSARSTSTTVSGDSVAEAAGSEATAVDPICGMTVAVADSTPHVEHEGETVYFCCAGCRTAFLSKTS